MIRTAWAYLVGFAYTLVWSLRIFAHRVTGSSRLGEITDLAARKWAGGILRAAGVRVRYENEALLPRDQAQVLVANHQSWFDVFALCATLPVDYRFVAKKELSKIPLFGQAWVTAGHYAIDRSDRQAAIESLNSVGEPMRAHRHSVVLFPEGTRSDDGQLGPFKKGAFVMAISAGVPVVPLAILGSRDIMPKGRWRIRSGEITIRVGEQIPTTGLTVADRDTLAWKAKRRIAELKGEASDDGSAPHQKASGGSVSRPDSPTEPTAAHRTGREQASPHPIT